MFCNSWFQDFTVDFDTVIESIRRVRFQLQYGDKEKLITKQSSFPTQLPNSLPKCPTDGDNGGDEASKCDVAFSYAAEDEKFALCLAKMLGKVSRLTVEVKPSSDLERLSLIDQAKHIVAILSPHYTHSHEKCEEFNIALSRQRISSGRILFPVHVHVLPQRPMYFRLVPSDVNVADKMWPALCNAHIPKINETMDVLDSHNNEIAAPTKLALHVAALQILQEIKTQRYYPAFQLSHISQLVVLKSRCHPGYLLPNGTRVIIKVP